MHLNRIEIIGNVGQDPEVRVRSSDGKKIVTFSVATSKRYKSADGETHEETQWHRVTAFPGTSEYVLACHTKKGSTVFCAGEMHYDKYTNQTTGQPQYSATIHLREFQMLSKPEKDVKCPYCENTFKPSDTKTPSQGQAAAQQEAPQNYHEDDLPF